MAAPQPSVGPGAHPQGPASSIAERDVLIVEDIIDTGLTLNYLLRYLRGKNPASLRICALLDKPARRLVEIPIDYRGFTIPDEFVVGYGLDFGEYYRNLPFIGVLRRELYETWVPLRIRLGRLLRAKRVDTQRSAGVQTVACG